jgi:hypothetical protein
MRNATWFRLVKAVVPVIAVLVIGVVAAKSVSGGAIVIKNDGSCGMPGSDANGNMIFGGIGTVTTLVENSNKIMISCKGSGITNLSGSGQSFKGFGCGIVDPNFNFFFTTDSSTTISASGQATLKCTATF